MRKFIKKFKNSITGNILKIIWKVLWWMIEALIIFIAIVIITQRVTNNEKAFLGFRIFSVATGSMEPQYAVGDILISREKAPSEIVVGDNIVYLGTVADYRGKIITHSVIEIEQNEEGEYLYHTKGIANNIEDPIVHEDQLYGVIFYNNEVLAFLCKILTNRYGLYFFIIVPIILTFFIGLIRNQEERMEQEREQERERRERQRRKQQKRREAENIEEIIQPIEEKTKRKTAMPRNKVELEEHVKENKQTTRRTSTSRKKVESEEPKTTNKKDVNEEGPVKNKKTTRAKKEKEE